ncbi:hypothetical protein ACWOAH_09775 [Vagococcus vulneris]|uniref:Uncharacterized protein n=1 Tax=Vagococcus vulneris TaxID=1977869 RepID=A0A429ZU15_9ENTE|nr:hypothetical protein [Vagococcus vulneris]RST97130.1 hypothetical protein CBF37_10135 [Vagococcus vulneris]
MNRRTLEQFYKLDVSYLRRIFKHTDHFKDVVSYERTSESGGLKRETTQSIPFEWIKAESVLVYGGRDISVNTTPCNYGGVRYWFRCGSCYENVGALYFTGERWECRKCGNLVYSSQQGTKTDFWHWYFKAFKVARQIDKDFWIDGFDFLFRYLYLFPSKPKYMKWSKYHRLRKQFNKYAERGNDINGKQLNAITSKYESKV